MAAGAEVGRIPRRARERRRRAGALVAERPAAPALLPGAGTARRAAAAPFGPPLGGLVPPHAALEGESVSERDGVLDFDSMQMRLPPAESRVRRLSAEIPAI